MNPIQINNFDGNSESDMHNTDQEMIAKITLNDTVVKSKCYLVVTEEWYGGKYKKVFANKIDAENYLNDVQKEHNLDMIIVETDIETAGFSFISVDH